MSEKLSAPAKAFGQPASTKEFESWLADKLDEQNAGKKFKDAKGYGWSAIIAGIVSVMLLIGMIITFVKDEEIGTRFYLLITFLAIAIITTITLSIAWSKIKAKNTSMILEGLPKQIYKEYFKRVYPDSPMKFEGLKASKMFPGTKNLNFSVDGEFIQWDIEEHTEKRTRKTKDGTQTYTVYIMQYDLIATSKKLNDFEEIHMAKRWLKHAPKKPGPDEFVSASMSFNKKYKITTNNPDKMQVTKLFDPSVIQYFDEMETFNPNTNSLSIKDGRVWFGWRSGDSEHPWNVKLNDFSYLSLDQETAAQKITQKITTDFNRFYQNFETLRPFDFYHLYSQLS